MYPEWQHTGLAHIQKSHRYAERGGTRSSCRIPSIGIVGGKINPGPDKSQTDQAYHQCATPTITLEGTTKKRIKSIAVKGSKTNKRPDQRSGRNRRCQSTRRTKRIFQKGAACLVDWHRRFLPLRWSGLICFCYLSLQCSLSFFLVVPSNVIVGVAHW